MLLLDDDDSLPLTPDEGETRLASQLGPDGLQSIDCSLSACASAHWLKVARIIHDALVAGGFSTSNEDNIRLHARRLCGPVESGALEARGNLSRPRRSEVRLPEGN